MESDPMEAERRERCVRAALYIRVSTDEQAQAGFSLAAQERRLRSYADSQDWQIAAVYRDEGHSGRTIKRPAYQKMMEDRGRWDVLLAMKMDRVHRSTRNFMQMMDFLSREKKDFTCSNESLDTSTAAARFFMDMNQRLAQMESEQIGERVMTGMMEKARSEKGWLTRPPYGYDIVDGQLRVNAEEARTVRWIFKQYRRGLTAYAIARALNDFGAKTKQGKRWKQGAVSWILGNQTYLGTRVWNDVVMEDNHEAIVTREEFDEAKRVAAARRKGPAYRKRAPLTRQRFPAEGSDPFEPSGVGVE